MKSKDYVNVFDQIKDSVIALDNNAKIRYANQAQAKIYGLTPKDLIGKSIWTVAPRTVGTIVQKKVEEALRKKRMLTFEWKGVYQNTIWETTLFPTDSGITAISRNIAKRKKSEKKLLVALQNSQRRQTEVESLLAASKVVLGNKDFKTTAKIIFDSCKELLGATSGYVALLSDDGKDNIVLFLESGGMPCSVDPSLPMPIRGLREIAYNTGAVIFENNFSKSKWLSLLPSGHVPLRNVLFAPLIVDGKTAGVIGLANKSKDFTEDDGKIAVAFGSIISIALINSQIMESLEEKNEKLRQYSQNLETLVEEKTNQLKNIERLATIGATAGMVGHDIRNPLQAIISDTFLLRPLLYSIAESEMKKEIMESLDSIDQNVAYINKIVQDLQDFAKPINPQFEEVNFKSLLHDVLIKKAIPKEIEASFIIGEDADKVEADSSLLKRILANLVNNAVQAMPDGGKLFIKTCKKPDMIILSVEDNGIGIPDEIKDKLFTPLFTTKSKGQGFGLAVVKRMTESLGGRVTFESEKGKGSKFTLELPIKH